MEDTTINFWVLIKLINLFNGLIGGSVNILVYKLISKYSTKELAICK